jgi:phosphate-selective porin OprO/OprP
MRVGLFLLLASQLMISSAYAGSEIVTLIDMLHQNGTVSDAQYERLMAELKQNQQVQAENQLVTDAKLAAATKPLEAKVKINGGGLAVSSSDGDFTTQVGGRLQLDAAHYSGRPEMGDGTEVRRAYLTLKGTMYRDWGYRLQYNFANTGSNGKGILDAYMDYKGMDDFDIRVGHFKEPFTLHEATSDNFVTFTERAFIAAFSPGRSIGVMAHHAQRNWTWAVGVFGEGVSAKGGTSDEGWGLSARTTFTPIHTKNRLVHFGLGANYRDTGGMEVARFKQRPESHVTDINIIDTGSVGGARSVSKLGVEFATTLGPFSAQAEYIRAHVNRDEFERLDLDGWYFETGYFLTGESRQYKEGKFGRPKPKANAGQAGLGAWQLALRYSTIDLTDGLVIGGEADAITVGVNWYPTPTLRFTANYVDVLSVDGGPYDDMETGVFQVRSQWAF